jgi:hypothetical protein
MRIESAGWGGEGTFTGALLEAFKAVESIEFLRVEDAPASRAEPGYAFISNEIYVKFQADAGAEVGRMTLGELAARLGRAGGVGEPDYSDDAMLQYLRTERIVAPYQTRGYKVIEMVRVYEVGTPRRE